MIRCARITVRAVACAALLAAGAASAAPQTLAFASDGTWQAFDASGAALGLAQPVCLDDLAPAPCPADALRYGFVGAGWGADLSSVPGAEWIWAPGVDGTTSPADLAEFTFVKTIVVPGRPLAGTLLVAADDFAEVSVNGVVAATVGSVVDQGAALAAQAGAAFDVAAYLKPGRNVVAVRAQNGPPSYAGTSGPNPYSVNPAAVVVGLSISYDGGPYSYWRFDEPSGSTAVDQAGANPGAIAGATRVPGVAGTALAFDGADDAVSFAETFLLHADSDASLLLWVRPADGEHRAVLWSRDGNGNPDADRFHLFSGWLGTLSCDDGAGFGLDYREPGSGLHRLLCAPGFPADQWHQLAVTRAGATYALYVDGELFQQVEDASPALPTYAGAWVIGSREAPFMFKGAIDELALYARALDADEVRLRYRRSFQGQGYEDAVPAAAPQTCTRWNLAADFRTPPAQANPSADACGNPVWSFLYAPTLSRDPATYLPLDAFQQSWFDLPGLAGWNVESPCFYGPTPCLPIAAYNGSGGTAWLPPWAPFPWDATTMLLHPGPFQPAVVAFRAPFSGTVDLEMAHVRHVDPWCSRNGVDWTFDVGAENVASGVAQYPAAQRFQAPLRVKAGEVLYATVGPNTPGDLWCDSTQVDLALRMRSIEAAIDVRPGVTAPNPIQLSAGGNVPVAILGSRALAAASVDPATLVLGGAPIALRGSAGRQVPQAALQDVNADGLLDLVAQFPISALRLPLGDGTATLAGALYDGTAVSGSDAVRVLK